VSPWHLVLFERRGDRRGGLRRVFGVSRFAMGSRWWGVSDFWELPARTRGRCPPGPGAEATRYLYPWCDLGVRG
jgi:hypothetical protein